MYHQLAEMAFDNMRMQFSRIDLVPTGHFFLNPGSNKSKFDKTKGWL